MHRVRDGAGGLIGIRSGIIVGKRPGNGVETSVPQTGPMFAGALSGFKIAVTADRRAEEQAELIARRGGEVVFGPVIRTLPLGEEAGLAEATAALLDQPPDIVVLSTAVGVRGWVSAAEALGLDDRLLATLGRAEVLARGPKAGGAALTVGLRVDWQAPTATYQEIVHELTSRRRERGDGSPIRVAVQLDGGDDSGIVATLAGLGYDVVAVPIYRWVLPEDITPAERVVQAVADGSIDAVTFTTAHAVTNFASIAQQMGATDAIVASVSRGSVVVVGVGPVTAARAHSVGFTSCVQPRNPRLGAMVQSLVVAFKDRVVTVDLDGIEVLIQGRLVSVGGGEPIRLTDREHAVLGALARRGGAVVSKQALLDEVWAGESDDHVVEVTIGRLRRRLGEAGGLIGTVVRRGYRVRVN